MSIIVFIVCLLLVRQRRRRHVTTVVPAVIGALAIVGSIQLVISLARAFETIASVSPSDKATILAAGISEAINASAFGLVFEIPLLVGAYFLDRWLRNRQ